MRLYIYSWEYDQAIDGPSSSLSLHILFAYVGGESVSFPLVEGYTHYHRQLFEKRHFFDAYNTSIMYHEIS